MDGVLIQIPTLDPATRWLLVIAVGMTILYAVMRPLRKKKDPLAKLSIRPSLSSQRAVERDMSNLLVELSTMARQVTAQLDTRTLKLEMLIKEADARITLMIDAAKQIPASNGHPISGTVEARMLAVSPIDPRHLEVYELADQSLSTQQISSKLNRPRGEIELILALRDRSENI